MPEIPYFHKNITESEDIRSFRPVVEEVSADGPKGSPAPEPVAPEPEPETVTSAPSQVDSPSTPPSLEALISPPAPKSPTPVPPAPAVKEKRGQ